MDVFHEGERAVQRRAGVWAEARSLGRGIASTIVPGAAAFVESQRFAVLAGVDAGGRVWASLATGEPGFMTVPDVHTLRLAADLPDGDPLRDAVAGHGPLGVLVLDPERRRRIRVNGRAVASRPGTIEVRVQEVFGNCPKYIQARVPVEGTARRRAGAARRSLSLGAAQRAAIEAADTFFVASVHERAGADASHRGGQPGFVRVDGARMLRFPDYAGNNMFQTLGNIARDPRVGLLFMDFGTGTTLQLTGRARLVWDRARFADLPGAERAVEVELDESVEIAHSGPPGWRFVEASPFNPPAA